MTDTLQIRYRDKGGEISNVAFTSSDITAANFDAKQTAAATLANAVAGVTLAAQAGAAFRQWVDPDEGNYPSSPYAQRELGLRIFYQGGDPVKKFHVTIPAPDLATLTIAEESDFVVLADGSVMAALVTALETDWLTPEGDALTVTKAVIVGRRN